MHIYTPEERAFFEEFTPGHSYKEIQQEFIKRFKWEISVTKVKGCIGRYKLNTGRNGRFVKGQVSPIKGMKMGKHKNGIGLFRKGHTPKNHRPVGSERITVDGYVEIKTAEPKTWRFKHVVVWEAENGPVPIGHKIVFLDSNRMNIDIKNLRMISNKVHARMCQNRLFSTDPEITEAGIHIAELMAATGDAKRRNKGEKKHGKAG